MPLTLEERERRAYITGNVELAEVLGGEIDAVDDRIAELESEVESLKDEVKSIEAERDEFERECNTAEDRAAALERENEEIRGMHLAALVGDDA